MKTLGLVMMFSSVFFFTLRLILIPFSPVGTTVRETAVHFLVIIGAFFISFGISSLP